MKWFQRNHWYWARECGRYTISRYLRADGDWDHLAWFVTPGLIATCISERAGTFEQAVKVCGLHARVRTLKANEAIPDLTRHTGDQQCA